MLTLFAFTCFHFKSEVTISPFTEPDVRFSTSLSGMLSDIKTASVTL